MCICEQVDFIFICEYGYVMETDINRNYIIAVLYLAVTDGSWVMDRYVNMILELLDRELISIQSEHGFFFFMLHGVHICNIFI